MHFHLPKPLHGWREFTGEVGIIVIGVLIALGAEQGVEAMHHRSQVHEATVKLRGESIDNRNLLDYDLQHLRPWIGILDRNIAALDGCQDPAAIQALEPIPQDPIFSPVDVAWQGARDSALTPLMPALLTDNYSKVDVMIGAYETRMFDLRREQDRTAGAVEAMRGGSRGAQVCNEALLALNELKQTELSVAQLALLLRGGIQSALRGERIGGTTERLSPISVAAR